ncbi:MAG: 23S rRNA (adenine(2503)-C(2))-methyltransferase RlmN [Candidatus Buchananbacteria bacterium]
MKIQNREEKFKKLFPSEPTYRIKQIQKGLFEPKLKDWDGFTFLSKPLREQLLESIDFISCQAVKILQSNLDQTAKAILKLNDDSLIETVLMENSRNQYTVCISSQVGCAMGCRFCATGRMGLTRSLEVDEIVDQYRFWQIFLADSRKSEKIITNIVVMGMGEPMANYENIKKAVSLLVDMAGLGETHITVSTIGLFPILAKVLLDKDWPNVRLAISLHASDYEIRKKIIPSTPTNYFQDLIDWSRNYLKKYGNRRHFLSFEYIMISGLNDSLVEAKKLLRLLKKIGHVKVNLIPCNDISVSELKKSQDIKIRQFSEFLIQNGIRTTIRRSMGQDIAAACGQLITKEKPPKSAK